MAFDSGARVGPYEIGALLGAGAMGEVYRARDTTLGRDVAVKVLPEALSRDEERIARFQREARFLASLSHANIATLYGVEEADGRLCLVMELVEGETLAERIARGPLAEQEAVRVFRQVAAGVEAAHGKGILHRDLKPANVKIAPDGTVRILDFGLAKTLTAPAEVPGESSSPTRTQRTTPGVAVGTPSYMSPEQTRGEPLDTRTDIWAFGCCLFEALSGKKPFDGGSVADVLASITRDEPPWSSLPAKLSPAVKRLLRRCLAKESARRYRHIGDAALDLELSQEDEGEHGPEPVAAPRLPKRYGFVLATLVAGALLGAVAVRTFDRPVAAPGRSARLQLVLEHGPLAMTGQPTLALSPDGERVAFISEEEGTRRLHVRALSEVASTTIRDSEGADIVYFSGDGRSVGFNIGTEWRRAEVTGTSSRQYTAGSAVTRGIWWSADDSIYLTATNAQGIGSMSRNVRFGEVSSPDPEENERTHSWPQVLPGASHALVTVVPLDGESYESARIAVIDMESGEPTTVLEGGYHGRAVASGHLLYVSEGDLLAAPFSLSRLEVTGPGEIVVPRVMADARTGAALYAVSQEGTLVYARGGPMNFGASRLVWVDPDGRSTPLLDESRVYRSPRLSPDESRLAVAVEGTSDDLWVVELARGAISRVTFDSRNLAPLWTNDGNSILFSSTREGIPLLYTKRADGSGDVRRIGDLRSASFPGDLASDGRLAFTAGSSRKDIWLTSTRPGAAAEALLDTRFREMTPSFSPDGRWLAFASDESGRVEVYIQPLGNAETGGKRTVSNDGGTEPIWSDSGDRIFYRSGQRMMAVPVTFEPEPRVGNPEVLFEGPYEHASIGGLVNYDVTSDGRFVMIEPIPHTEGPRELQVVLGFFDELRRRVPPPE